MNAMSLVRLRLRTANETPTIYVNSDHIVTMRDFGEYCHIVTNVTDGGRAWQFSVIETTDEVIALIKMASKEGTADPLTLPKTVPVSMIDPP
jgi:hypothetical protein